MLPRSAGIDPILGTAGFRGSNVTSASDFYLSGLLLLCFPHSQSLNGGPQQLQGLILSSSNPAFQQLGQTMVGSNGGYVARKLQLYLMTNPYSEGAWPGLVICLNLGAGKK